MLQGCYKEQRAMPVLDVPGIALTIDERMRFDVAAQAICNVSGCDKPAKGRGLCGMHWRRWRRNGDPLKARVYTVGVSECRICGREGKTTQGLCSSHYHRLDRYGDPTAGAKARPPAGAPLAYLLAHMHDGCSYPWPFATFGTGALYPQVKVDGEKTPGHRLVCELAHGPPPTPEHEAAHGCNNSLCFNADCLRWATTAENNADKLVHGTHNRGERHNMARLTVSNVREIRADLVSTNVALAARFGVSTAHISAIKSRKYWAWLDEQESS